MARGKNMQLLTHRIKDFGLHTPKSYRDFARVWVKIVAGNRYRSSANNGTFLGVEVVNCHTCGIGKIILRAHGLVNKGGSGSVFFSRFPGLLDKHRRYSITFGDFNLELCGIDDIEINTLYAPNNFTVSDFAAKEDFYCTTFIF